MCTLGLRPGHLVGAVLGLVVRRTGNPSDSFAAVVLRPTSSPFVFRRVDGLRVDIRSTPASWSSVENPHRANGYLASQRALGPLTLLDSHLVIGADVK